MNKFRVGVRGGGGGVSHGWKLLGHKLQYLQSVLPLAGIFPCSKEILVHARNLQGNEMHKEMARKNTKIKGIARISVTYTSLKFKTT
jgi:hypothetical protein